MRIYECNDLLKPHMPNMPERPGSIFCTKSGHRFPRGNTCRGDSGSFFGVQAGYVAGITSFGIGECGSELFGVVTNVFYFKDWILDKCKQCQR